MVVAVHALLRTLPIWLAGLAISCTTVPQRPADELLREGKVLFDNEKYGTSRHWFRACKQRYPNLPEAEEATYLQAESNRLKRYSNAALTAYREFAENFPNSRFAVAAAEGEYQLGTAQIDGKIGGGFLFGPNRSLGVDILEHMQIAYKNHSLADDALIKIANYQMKEKRYEEAIDTCKRILSDYPRREHTPYVRYLLATAQWHRSEGALYDEELLIGALRTLEDFIATVRKTPDGSEKYKEQIAASEKLIVDVRERLGKKQILIADFYERRGEPISAMVYYNYCIRKYPASDASKKAKERLIILEKKQVEKPKAKETPES
jgi:outer membrane protein assembly factor BamD (BamD/ComL family)